MSERSELGRDGERSELGRDGERSELGRDGERSELGRHDQPGSVKFALAGAVGRVEDDRTARLAMWLVWPLGMLAVVLVGRHAWFLRDDWAFLLARERLRHARGLDDMLLAPQDGHWMTGPLLVYRGLHTAFGTGSYIPYLAVLWVTHAGAVALALAWMRRLDVRPWTATLLIALLLVFGGGWENVVFAVQITYGFSLLAFLGQALLADHDGPIDRRDWAGVAISLVGVSSSGFGPFFAFGVGLLLVLRRRWAAAALAVVPQALAWGWWWLAWGSDPVGDEKSAGLSFTVHFAAHGLGAAFGSLTGFNSLGWPAIVLCAAIAVWPGTSRARRAPIVALGATAVVMLAGIGTRRALFGLAAAGWPRYQYMVAMIVAPVLGVALDHAPRFASWARWVPRAVLVLAIGRNAVWLRDGGEYWADLGAADRRVVALVAGSEERHQVPPDRAATLESPDLLVSDLDELVADGAITPIVPVTPEDRAIVARTLGLTVPG